MNPFNWTQLEPILWNVVQNQSSSSNATTSSTSPPASSTSPWYTVCVVGFFGFMIFLLMVNNYINNPKPSDRSLHLHQLQMSLERKAKGIVGWLRQGRAKKTAPKTDTVIENPLSWT